MQNYLILLLLLFLSCTNTPSEIVERDYQLINDEGIYVEVFDSTIVDENRYTRNNTTFKEGIVFIYNYYHLTKDGEKYLFELDKSNDDWQSNWQFVPISAINDTTITRVELTVNAGLQPFIQNMPDYNQTIIQYDYPTMNGEFPFNSKTGVIENEKNIWMHPPRSKYFRILELNPFPFIQAPFEVGTQWEWSLKIGAGWGDERWKIWEGSIENKYQYEITDKKKITTKFGELDCFTITSTANSRIGNTALTALFHPKYGFIELDYTNIDGSKTILELVEYRSPYQ